MKMYKMIFAFLLVIALSFNVCAKELYSLPQEFADEYPYRESQTTIKYAPWFTLVNRASPQSLQGGTNAGENCQVTGTIAFSDVNPKHVIAGFDTNGVAISTDGGENWFYSQSDIGTHGCMTALWHPSDENTVYRVSNAYNGSRHRKTILDMAENKGLMRSKDCGKTWEVVLNESMHSEYGAHTAVFDGNGNLYALTNNGLFKSADGGDSWKQLNTFKNWSVYDVEVSSDGQTILTGTVNGLYASLDAGKTWELKNGKQFYGNVSGVDIDPLDKKHWVAAFFSPYKCFAESYDYGRSWSAIDSPFSAPFKIKFGGIRSDGTRYLYSVGRVGANSAYRYSKDNGATWQRAIVDTKQGAINDGTQLEGLALSKKYPDIVWYAFADGINCSYDAGVHFYNKSAGHGGQKCFSKIVTDDEGRIHFPGTDTGYFHTIAAYESGRSFPACTQPFRMWGPAIAISKLNPNYMLLGGGEQGDKVIYRSLDKGENWMELKSTLSATNYSLIEFHNKNKNIIYTNQSTSFDGGETFKPNETPIYAVSPIDNDVLLSRDSYDSSTNQQNLKVSYNCGATWKDYLALQVDLTVQSNNAYGFTLYWDKFKPDKVWAYQYSGSKLMSYYKNTLEYIYDFKNLVDKEVQVNCFAQDPRDENHLLVALMKPNMDIGYGIAESFDGGENWTVVPGNPGNGWITMICFEERTNDIFINSYCGLVIYDSREYQKYVNSKK